LRIGHFERKQITGAYRRIGVVAAMAVSALTFFGSWIYAIVTYGVLLGGGLGWIPGAIIAGIAGGVTYLVWPLIALAIMATGIFIFQT